MTLVSGDDDDDDDDDDAPTMDLNVQARWLWSPVEQALTNFGRGDDPQVEERDGPASELQALQNCTS